MLSENCFIKTQLKNTFNRKFSTWTASLKCPRCGDLENNKRYDVS